MAQDSRLTKDQKKANLANAMPGETSLEDIFPIELIEGKFIVAKHGHISMGLKLSLPNAESYSPNEIENFNDTFVSILSNLPRNTVVHKQDIYYYTENALKLRKKEKAMGYFQSKISGHFDDRYMLQQETYIYLCFPPDQHKLKTASSTSFASKFLPKNPFEGLEERKTKAIEAARTFLNQLSSFKNIKAKVMDDDELWDRFYQYFTLRFGQDVQHLDKEFENNGSNVKVGNKKVQFVFLKEPGNEIFVHRENDRRIQTFMPWPVGAALREPHVVNTAIYIADTESILGDIDSERKMISSLGSFVSQGNAVSNAQLESFTGEVRAAGTNLVYMAQNVMMWDTDSDRLDNTVDACITAYKKMNNSDAITCSFDNTNYFMTYSPGMAMDMFNAKRYTAHQAVCYLDFSATPKGDTGGIIVTNREHEPVWLDLWSSFLDNKNRLIIGPSGSGKSYVTNNIVAQQHEQGFDQLIIDVGGSYKNIVNTLKGQYYEYDPENPLTFNPFLLDKNKEGRYEINPEKLTFLLSLITVIWKDTDSGEKLSKDEESIISDFIERYYSSLNLDLSSERPRFDRFIEFVESEDEVRKGDPEYDKKMKLVNLTSFFNVMRKFVDGRYKNVLNSEDTTVLSDERLICFDMMGVQKDPILYPVVALIIIELVLDKIKRYPSIKKEIYFDEAWSMLKTGALAGFIENMYRTIRKYNGATSIITQSIVELKGSLVGDVAKNQSATKILLDHKTQTSLFDDIKAYLGFTDLEMKKLSSIRSEGTRREFFVKRADVCDIYGIEVGQHAHANFSSKAEEREKMATLKEVYQGNNEFATEQFVEDMRKEIQ